jgi:hypothetical protein
LSVVTGAFPSDDAENEKADRCRDRRKKTVDVMRGTALRTRFICRGACAFTHTQMGVDLRTVHQTILR